MHTCVVADSGPLLAFLDPAEARHREVVAAMRDLPLPWLTAESVLSELTWLLRRNGRRMTLVNRIVASGMVEVVPLFPACADDIAELMARYENVPMSLADACLVKLSELHADAALLTFDSDFRIYRRFQREPVPLVRLPQRVQERAPDYATTESPSSRPA